MGDLSMVARIGDEAPQKLRHVEKHPGTIGFDHRLFAPRIKLNYLRIKYAVDVAHAADTSAGLSVG
jgi:hypothetical protein